MSNVVQLHAPRHDLAELAIKISNMVHVDGICLVEAIGILEIVKMDLYRRYADEAEDDED